MKNGPLVSICMPVLNGELFLQYALNSLLAQDYNNIEIIILDNMSTDSTPRICQKYAKDDSRIRYILDDMNRITHDAANHLSTFINGEYTMLACDDDLWEPDFISTMVSVLEENPETGMAYSNADYVDIRGRLTNKSILRSKRLYGVDDSRYSNCCHFIVSKHIVPMIFGVFKTSVYMKALPFDTFDETIADVDNLFMFKLLTITKVMSVDRILFHYRDKHRWADPDILMNYPQKKTQIFQMLLYYLKHQHLFMKKIFDVIHASAFLPVEKSLLRKHAIYSFLRHGIILKLWSLINEVLKSKNYSRDLSAVQRHNALLAMKDRDKQ